MNDLAYAPFFVSRGVVRRDVFDGQHVANNVQNSARVLCSAGKSGLVAVRQQALRARRQSQHAGIRTSSNRERARAPRASPSSLPLPLKGREGEGVVGKGGEQD